MTTAATQETVTLPPSYAIAIALILGAVGFGSLALVMGGMWAVGLAGLVGLFGIFLLYQTVTLRLVFTPTRLEVYRGDRCIRQFPYADWQHWQIFWSPVPVLFYFREVNSVHFVPILFDPEALRSQLHRHLPQMS